MEPLNQNHRRKSKGFKADFRSGLVSFPQLIPPQTKKRHGALPFVLLFRPWCFPSLAPSKGQPQPARLDRSRGSQPPARDRNRRARRIRAVSPKSTGWRSAKISSADTDRAMASDLGAQPAWGLGGLGWGATGVVRSTGHGNGNFPQRTTQKHIWRLRSEFRGMQPKISKLRGAGNSRNPAASLVREGH